MEGRSLALWVISPYHHRALKTPGAGQDLTNSFFFLFHFVHHDAKVFWDVSMTSVRLLPKSCVWWKWLLRHDEETFFFPILNFLVSKSHRRRLVNELVKLNRREPFIQIWDSIHRRWLFLGVKTSAWATQTQKKSFRVEHLNLHAKKNLFFCYWPYLYQGEKHFGIFPDGFNDIVNFITFEEYTKKC